ncbi:glycosyltransferase family 2 protein [Candidatus Bipolaricaulota bacterium]|nr:glycosyltransferase family 2 protein [Candidatus Bipolaricaulota bacterium]
MTENRERPTGERHARRHAERKGQTVEVLISIITPTYNREETLPRLYRSLVKQTVKDFEWVVVDDGSTDGTGQFLEGISGRHLDWIQVKYLPRNLGVSVARNVGARVSRGDWVLFIDSDDELDPSALDIAAGYAKRAAADVGAVTFQIVRLPDNRRIGYYPDTDEWETRPLPREDIVLKRGLVGDVFWMVRKDVFRGGFRFPPWLNGFERLSWGCLAREWAVQAVNHSIGCAHYDDPGLGHLSYEVRKRQPKLLATAYILHVRGNRDIWWAHPSEYARIARSVAVLFLRACHVHRAVYWYGVSVIQRARSLAARGRQGG